ncbi:DUF1735 domain-containing protein [Pedobacter montanisoli]|uniref:DUF1735 domain-containing protein n=1 Tax=Pedobacter montanisoli TaxID=2923277 RepID=A0ABS9ZTA0_9SPHI|nr:DUF1735 domain-containing protein [Pedobacter montanisoli]MCJ0741835.1 DUF1735 domain-containing protein [Pedobacter montanisoli]
MKKRYIYLLLSIVLFGTTIGCRKDSFEGESAADKGVTMVKLLEAPSKSLYFTPFTGVKEKIQLFSVRKDAASAADLNTASKVTLVSDPAAITAYNTANGTDYELLPEAIYTLAADAGVTKTATGFTIDFAAGDFSKNIKINLNGSLWDLSKKYAVAYKIDQTNGLYKKKGSESIIVLISIKNAYDGVYTVDGTCVDANGLYKGDYPRTFSLTTASTTAVSVYDIDYDFDRYIVINNAGTSAANTGIGLKFDFDPVTNNLVSVSDPFSPARVFTNVSGKFNPGDRSVTVKWTSGRWTVSEKWTFEEER